MRIAAQHLCAQTSDLDARACQKFDEELTEMINSSYLGPGSLSEPDGVPDAGQPVSHQGEGGHEEDEDGGPVLRVSVDLPRHPHQSQEAGRLQQTN